MSTQETIDLRGLQVQPAPATATLAANALQARYTLPPIEELTDSPEEIGEKQARIRNLPASETPSFWRITISGRRCRRWPIA